MSSRFCCSPGGGPDDGAGGGFLPRCGLAAIGGEKALITTAGVPAIHDIFHSLFKTFNILEVLELNKDCLPTFLHFRLDHRGTEMG